MKTLFGKKGQMSVEILLITGVIIIISIGVFSYYTRIMDTTTAMEIIEIETLRQLDANQGQYFMEPIGYKIDGSIPPIGVYFCIELTPGPAGLDTGIIEDAVESKTGFASGTVSVTENTPINCQP
jgi:hypothetical protein